jgi:hypothetical protein
LRPSSFAAVGFGAFSTVSDSQFGDLMEDRLAGLVLTRRAARRTPVLAPATGLGTSRRVEPSTRCVRARVAAGLRAGLAGREGVPDASVAPAVIVDGGVGFAVRMSSASLLCTPPNPTGSAADAATAWPAPPAEA